MWARLHHLYSNMAVARIFRNLLGNLYTIFLFVVTNSSWPDLQPSSRKLCTCGN